MPDYDQLDHFVDQFDQSIIWVWIVQAAEVLGISPDTIEYGQKKWCHWLGKKLDEQLRPFSNGAREYIRRYAPWSQLCDLRDAKLRGEKAAPPAPTGDKITLKEGMRISGKSLGQLIGMNRRREIAWKAEEGIGKDGRKCDIIHVSKMEMEQIARNGVSSDPPKLKGWMTAAEIWTEHGIDDATIRAAVRRGEIGRRKFRKLCYLVKGVKPWYHNKAHVDRFVIEYKRRKAVLESAKQFLLEALGAKGYEDRDTILQEAESKEIPIKTVWRAKEELGIEATRSGWQGGSYWHFPATTLPKNLRPDLAGKRIAALGFMAGLLREDPNISLADLIKRGEQKGYSLSTLRRAAEGLEWDARDRMEEARRIEPMPSAEHRDKAGDERQQISDLPLWQIGQKTFFDTEKALVVEVVEATEARLIENQEAVYDKVVEELIKRLLPEMKQLALVNPSAANPSDAYYTYIQLADIYNLPQEALRLRLERWRLRHPPEDGWEEVGNPKPHKPKYLFLLSAVKPVIDEMLSTAP